MVSLGMLLGGAMGGLARGGSVLRLGRPGRRPLTCGRERGSRSFCTSLVASVGEWSVEMAEVQRLEVDVRCRYERRGRRFREDVLWN